VLDQLLSIYEEETGKRKPVLVILDEIQIFKDGNDGEKSD